MPAPVLTPEARRLYWRRTSRLMWTALLVWFLVGFVVHLFAPSLAQLRFLGFPLAFLVAAQGAPLIFVAVIFWHAARQDAIDDDLEAGEP